MLSQLPYNAVLYVEMNIQLKKYWSGSELINLPSTTVIKSLRKNCPLLLTDQNIDGNFIKQVDSTQLFGIHDDQH